MTSVRVGATPNPNAMNFTTDSMIFKGDNSISVMPGQTSEHKILNDLMEISGVDNVFGFQNFITVNKNFDTEWDALTPKIQEVLNGYGY